MKKIVTVIVAFCIFAADNVFAQIGPNVDWAGFSRYSQTNMYVDHAPKAVFMGDSITDNWGRMQADFFDDNDILCRGISGQTTSQMLVRFRKDVVALHPEYVLIMAGTNDIARNTGMIAHDDIAGNIASMCEIARSNGIKPVIVSITPADHYGWRMDIKDAAEQIIHVNELLRQYAEESDIPYVDLHSVMVNDKGGLPVELSKDGVHPTLAGYNVMGPLVLETIK